MKKQEKQEWETCYRDLQNHFSKHQIGVIMSQLFGLDYFDSRSFQYTTKVQDFDLSNFFAMSLLLKKIFFTLAIKELELGISRQLMLGREEVSQKLSYKLDPLEENFG